jgi:transposase
VLEYLGRAMVYYSQEDSMPSRTYQTDPAQLLAEGQMIVSSAHDAKFQHKVEIVNLVLSGLTPSFLSKYCGESKNTITLWVKTADEQGFNALKVKKQSGRPMKLSPEQLSRIKGVIEEDNPHKYGYRVWDGPGLSDYIKKTYSVSLGIRQCQRMFHNLGFSLVRPQTLPGKDEENTREREDFKKN